MVPFYSSSATEHIVSEGLLCPRMVSEVMWSRQLCEPLSPTLNLDLVSGSQSWLMIRITEELFNNSDSHPGLTKSESQNPEIWTLKKLSLVVLTISSLKLCHFIIYNKLTCIKLN